MKYKIFITDNITALENEILIGEADTYPEVCKCLTKWLNDKATDKTPYWRFIMDSTATFIDFGSWAHFAAVIPPIPMREMTGDEEDS